MGGGTGGGPYGFNNPIVNHPASTAPFNQPLPNAMSTASGMPLTSASNQNATSMNTVSKALRAVN